MLLARGIKEEQRLRTKVAGELDEKIILVAMNLKII